jgi:HD-GYP domain-containing protein (c-di-GMP phosphodiesterase class II)
MTDDAELIDLEKKMKDQGHARRVTAFTIAITRVMGLSIEQIKMMARGAFLHDMGKIAIPSELLLKPSALTPVEMIEMREHSFLGYRMVSKFRFLRGADEIVHSHHERYDGSGYPRRLKGQEIPLGARIVAVANALDSITSDLPYRQAQTFHQARQIIQNCSGSQFDPVVVRAYQRMPDKLFEELRSSIKDV